MQTIFITMRMITFNLILRKELSLVPVMPVFAVYFNLKVIRLYETPGWRNGSNQRLLLKFSESIN